MICKVTESVHCLHLFSMYSTNWNGDESWLAIHLHFNHYVLFKEGHTSVFKEGHIRLVPACMKAIFSIKNLLIMQVCVALPVS